MSNKQIKSRAFVGVWYPDEDMSHLFAINKLNECGYKYVAIDHDKDVYDSHDECDPSLLGSLKKKHTHVYIRFKNPRYLEPVADELEIKTNYLQPCRDTPGALGYMIHDGFPDKYQYPVEELYGPLKVEVEKLMVCEDEGSRVLRVLDVLDSMPCPCTYRKFLVAVCECGLYGEFRRMGSGIVKLLDEHNMHMFDPE